MKRCPECYEAYKDSEQYCELDGQRLLPNPSVIAPSAAESVNLRESGASENRSTEFTSQRDVWLMGTAGVVLGVVVCLGGYLAYGFWNDDRGFKEPGAATFTSQTKEPINTSRSPVPRSQTTLPEEEVATSEPEASPEPSSSPTEESNAVAARLNQGPVSTGQREKDADDKSEVQTIIQMNDGTAVEVDAAWEDGQGVWYRRGGMVAFVESQRVKAITGRAAQKPSSGSNQ